MKYSIKEKSAGELAARDLSEKARAFYNATDPLSIFEYKKDDQKLYAVDFAGEIRDGLTLTDLDRVLCEYADSVGE